MYILAAQNILRRVLEGYIRMLPVKQHCKQQRFKNATPGMTRHNSRQVGTVTSAPGLSSPSPA